MSAVMSPVGVAQQFFNNQGVILSGGLLYTYAAGTTTPAATYTDNTLGTPNANPIVLDSSGRYSQEIWWASGNQFKFILKDASGNTIATWDNLVGINDVVTAASVEWNSSNLTPTYVSATSFTFSGNQTSLITPNLRLQSTNTGGTIYSSVTSSTYSGGTGLTTVVVVNDSGVLDSGLSAVKYGFLNSVHTSMPPFVDASPVVQNSSDPTKLIRFNAASITTGNVRTITVPDASLTLTSSHPMELRLTLATGVPVTTTDQTAKTTLYLTPYKGGNIDLFDGTIWNTLNTAEVNIAVPSTTATNYDVFVYNNAGVATLELTAWTNQTTRATALTYQNGVLVKTGVLTRRYVGSFCTTGVSGQTEDSLANRFVWNYYNRILRPGRGTFSADRSTSSATYVELNSEIRNNFIVGVSEDPIFVSVNGTQTNATGTVTAQAIGFDGTAAEAGFEMCFNVTGTWPVNIAQSGYKTNPAIGIHYATLLGAASGASTGVWAGSTVLLTKSKVYLQTGIWG